MEIELLQNPAALWLLAGIILALSEFLVPGLVIVFFGAGALITSLLTYIMDVSVTLQVVIFLATSVIFLLIFRGMMKQRFFREIEEKDESSAKEFIGQTAVVTRVGKDKFQGHIEFRGTSWSVRSTEPLKIGDEVEITSKESIKLNVSKKAK